MTFWPDLSDEISLVQLDYSDVGDITEKTGLKIYCFYICSDGNTLSEVLPVQPAEENNL